MAFIKCQYTNDYLLTLKSQKLTICKRYSTAAISKNPRKQGKKEIIKAQNYHKFVN